MKKTIIAAVTALTLTTGAISGLVYAHSYQGNAGKGLERMTERLSLTAEQQADVQQIFDQHMLDRKEMMENAHTEDREHQGKLDRQGMRAELKSDIRSLLTPEQVALFDQMHLGRERKGGYEGEHEYYEEMDERHSKHSYRGHKEHKEHKECDH